MSTRYREFADADRLAVRARLASGPVAFAAACLLLGVAAAALLLQNGAREKRAETPAIAAPPPLWIEDVDGPRLFAVQAGAFGAAPVQHRLRRQSSGPGRIEQIAFGAPQVGAPYLRLSVYRAAEGGGAGVSFWLEMARRAGEAGFSVEKTQAVPDEVATRLGAFHVGQLRMRNGEAARACLGFRHEAFEPPLVISGFACLDAPAAEAQDALTCALESLSIVEPAADPQAAAFFARARARGAECRLRTAHLDSSRR